jgi:predicted transcriptional regulator
MNNQLSQIQEEQFFQFPKDILKKETISIIKEILNADRLRYLKILQKWGPMSSTEVTQVIIAIKKMQSLKEINENDTKKHYPNISARLTELNKLGVLNKDDLNFSISPVGFFLINLMEIMDADIKVITKNKQFLDFHDYSVIPSQEISGIYNLQFSNQCATEIDYHHILEEKTGGVSEQIKIITDRLHDIPYWICKEIKNGSINFKLLYQFKNPFKINSNDEEEYTLWKYLLQDPVKGELRFLSQSGGSPIGIRIINDRWALLNLYEFTEEKLNRSRSFYGEDSRFVSWVIDIFWNYWNNANKLTCENIEKIRGEIGK